MSIAEYESQFTELARYAPHMVDIDYKEAKKFEGGLNVEILDRINVLKLLKYVDKLNKSSMDSITNLLLSSFLCSILVVSTTAVNTISTTQSIKDGDTIVSIGGSFALGFFSPGSSKKRYIGIWYNKISNDSRTVVWVANRETPVTDSSGVLMVTQQGVLVLLNSTESIILSSNLTKPGKTPVAELLDSGNFVLRNADDDNPQNYLWQSFDHPTDTFLPGMKFGINYKTGLDMILRSWQSSDDPAQGDYTYSMDSHGFPQYFLRKDTVKVFRSGPWNGVRFSGMPTISSNPIYNFTFVLNQNETYFNYDLLNSSVVTRMLDNKEQITNMFWTDAQMIMDYAQFGDVITFDTTYKLNKKHKPFASFVGFNHHRETIIFGTALLYDETVESFVWLFQNFLEAMSGKAPKTLFTDQDAAMAKAIPIVMPDTSH
ncbi:G-type lectin S-receptor-like serine/threonine-protein kinase At4g27290 [Camellia sinensis]|uniref:G-type lectin S-receptor-like serine/threonine-protein kinase At4g27290 n=1 Tax=Camellia sinensis TaxID=4442 RepID=UPI00103593D3|nr:G-type lectin S-receptor-like serine/threonine-protein kinase At4g27290 [Camellia sinensis]